MGQATRTTKLLLDLGKRTQGGTNTGKRAYLGATVDLLNAARAFYVAFFLAHADKFSERVSFFSAKYAEERERALSTSELLTWAEFLTIETNEHPDPLSDWHFSQSFPDFPFIYRRAVIKDAIGKVKSYLSNLSYWNRSGKKMGKPGLPGTNNHPTLYEGLSPWNWTAWISVRALFGSKSTRGSAGRGRTTPSHTAATRERRRTEPGWEQRSPRLVLRPKHAELHFSQVKEVKARKVNESKQDPDLVTVAVDLNVKNLAVITVRRHGNIIETVFVTIEGSISTATGISSASTRNSGSAANPSRASATQRSSGAIFVACMQMPLTRRPAPLPVSVRSIPAVCCSLSDYAKSRLEGQGSHVG
jgi:hypothetical protein